MSAVAEPEFDIDHVDQWQGVDDPDWMIPDDLATATLSGGALSKSVDPDSLASGGLVTDVTTRHLAATDSINESEMSVAFTILTRSDERNRHGCKVQLGRNKFGRGVVTDHFKANPVILLNHGWEIPLPIGLAQPTQNGKVDLKRKGQSITSRVWFDQDSEVASETFRMVRAGLLRMASVGFRAIKAVRLGDRKEKTPDGVFNFDDWIGGLDYVESELQEWSVVPIGADRGALRQAVSRGRLDGEKLSEFGRIFMAKYAEPKPSMSGWTPGVEASFSRGSDSLETLFDATISEAARLCGGHTEKLSAFYGRFVDLSGSKPGENVEAAAEVTETDTVSEKETDTPAVEQAAGDDDFDLSALISGLTVDNSASEDIDEAAIVAAVAGEFEGLNARVDKIERV